MPSLFPRSAITLLMLVLPLAFLLPACEMNPTGLETAEGWQHRSVAVWRNTRPDMLALSPNGKWLYVSCEANAATNAPSLAAINLESGRQHFLLFGLMRADALKFAPDGSLWLGEEFPEGLIWRIADVDKLPEEQTVERVTLRASHPSVQPFRPAGRFSHEGLTFSGDRRYAYLADEHPTGAIYRMRLDDRKLQVLDHDMRWQAIDNPDDARAEARAHDAATFNRLEDMETLPDGRILLAETDTGRILAMTDKGTTASIETLLQDARIEHPDNLAWDAKRRLLWITDDSEPSALWAWDGRQAFRVGLHRKAEITGVLPVGDDIYINLQGMKGGPELTVRIYEDPNRESPAP